MTHSRVQQKMLLLILSLFFCYTIQWSTSLFIQTGLESWYVNLKKPFWNPPNLAFPIIWTIIYTLIGIAFGKVLCVPQAYKLKLFLIFFTQMFLNFTWSFSFFYLQSPLTGLVNIILLLVAIVWNMKAFGAYSKTALKLLIPYFLWVSYAASLNLAIWYLN